MGPRAQGQGGGGRGRDEADGGREPIGLDIVSLAPRRDVYALLLHLAAYKGCR